MGSQDSSVTTVTGLQDLQPRKPRSILDCSNEFIPTPSAQIGIDTIDSPDDEHMAARNMLRIEMNIYEKETVLQVGYLQILYQVARSTKHKIHISLYLTHRQLCLQLR